MNGWRRNSYLRYCSPTPKIILFGAVILFFAGLIKVFEFLAMCITKLLRINILLDFTNIIAVFLALSAFVILLAILERIFRGSERDIKYIVRKRLCAVSFGNPLHLREGEIEPLIKVQTTKKGYKITVECQSANFDDVSSLVTVISGCLRRKYGNYAVVAKEEDIAGRYVDYFIEDFFWQALNSF